MDQESLEHIYRNTPPESIPWVREAPPGALIELVNSGKVKACTTIDMGCGTGDSALYLSGRGFDVTGVDSSPTAIETAKQKAAEKAVQVRFVVADVLGDLRELKTTFSFIYDWSLLHHIYPENREKYFKNVDRLLNPGGKYLSVCFNEKDTYFGGEGKYRRTPIGTTLYFSSENELRELFGRRFKILQIRTISIPGKDGDHLSNLVFMQKEAGDTG